MLIVFYYTCLFVLYFYACMYFINDFYLVFTFISHLLLFYVLFYSVKHFELHWVWRVLYKLNWIEFSGQSSNVTLLTGLAHVAAAHHYMSKDKHMANSHIKRHALDALADTLLSTTISKPVFTCMLFAPIMNLQYILFINQQTALCENKTLKKSACHKIINVFHKC